MIKITEDMSDEEKFDIRKTRIKRRCIYINLASGISFLLVFFWAGVRMFFCWEDSCSGVICWFCELHWLISILLIVFLFGFFMMSADLYRVSRDQKLEPLPEQVDDPWIPGVKTTTRTLQGLSSTIQKVTTKIGKVPGSDALAKYTQRVGTRTKAIPGVKALQKGTNRAIESTSHAYHRMEHGRRLMKGQGPERGTFLFSFVALAAALFLMFGPFKNIFWS